MMLIAATRVRVGCLMAMLLAATVSSSFVPRTSLIWVSRTYPKRSFLSIIGGSDDGDVESPHADQPQVSFPDPIQQAAVPQAHHDGASVSVPADVYNKDNLGPKAPTPGLLRRTFPAFPWNQVPNYLTYVRCLAIPVLVYIFYQPNMNVAAGIVFAIASFTDWLDGYLARRWDITSPFGAFLDPVADKLMVSTSLILLSGRYGAKVAVPAAVILAREIAVSALREWMAQRGQRDIVKVGYQGKVKTALTMFALTVLLLVPYPIAETGFLSRLLTPSLTMLYLSSLVTVTSGTVYFIAAAPLLKGDSR